MLDPFILAMFTRLKSAECILLFLSIFVLIPVFFFFFWYFSKLTLSVSRDCPNASLSFQAITDPLLRPNSVSSISPACPQTAPASLIEGHHGTFVSPCGCKRTINGKREKVWALLKVTDREIADHCFFYWISKLSRNFYFILFLYTSYGMQYIFLRLSLKCILKH